MADGFIYLVQEELGSAEIIQAERAPAGTSA